MATVSRAQGPRKRWPIVPAFGVCRGGVQPPILRPLVARTKKAPAGTVDGGAAEDTMGIDEILDRLEGVVQALEAGDLPLEEALRRFEHGVGLARRGSTLLDAVEERVEQLLSDRDEAVPLTSEEPR